MQCSSEPYFVKEESRQARQLDYSENSPVLEDEFDDFLGGNDDDDE